MLTERLGGIRVPVPAKLLGLLAASGAEVRAGEADRAGAARDWWPLSIGWAAQGKLAARPAAVVRPTDAGQVSATLVACSDARVPVTPMAGRSGVCGGAVPVFGGVALDCTGLVDGLRVDETSLLADVPAGLFGPALESALRTTGTGYTLGHWPQSMELSTVGGWLACRSAGQYSTRYGKIEDMVVGLQVVLADGSIVETEGRAPRAATGPNLTQLFVGSEGVLGVITGARLRIRPSPPAEGRRAFGFPHFADGLDACRRIVRRGASPAVLRLYDRTESRRTFGQGGACVLVVLDEADPGLLAATLAVVDEECRTAGRLDDGVVATWLSTRNDVSALGHLWQSGVVVDTAEIAGTWSVLGQLADEVPAALAGIPGTLAATVHQSHCYPEGACLYFTFAGSQPHGGPVTAPDTPDDRATDDLGWSETYYRRAWDTLTGVVASRGAAISHHHGIGLNRSRFLPVALGSAYPVLVALKRTLDPAGILNPGKLGLSSPFGEVPWA
ncbi:MAG: FAD-binding oxidoreductase [Acidimicrobiales bacterium]